MVNEVLQDCVIEGNVVKLPNIKLDRKQYLEVKKALELIGGKWKGGKVAGFVFKTNPKNLLKSISDGSKVNLKKKFQFFATPDCLAERLVYYADLQTHDTILEPSAGQGAIIKQINKQNPTAVPDCYELMDVNKIILNESELKFNIIGDDFLKSDDKGYSAIIANPPFSKNQDIDHVYKMYDKLNRGGRIVTIMSKHWQNSSNKKETEFRNWLDELDSEVIEIAAGEFKESGTSIATVIVIINKNLQRK